MKRTFARFVLVCLLLATLFTSAPMRPVQAQTPVQKQSMPAGLQRAFLAATAKPFSALGGTYTTEYNGLGYKLDVKGLQAEGNGIQWDISLRGMGRGNQAKDVGAPEIVQTDGKLEYRRGLLTEWYRSTVLGVEQGFTINESPKGNGKLVLHLDLSSNVEGKLNDDERGISFAGADGQILRYDQLKAYDANSVELNAKMVYNPAQIIIQVDDLDAVYPITIDPLIYLDQKVIALDGAASADFGYSVAISGNTALVGAQKSNSSQGSAYVFIRSGTTWVQQAKLTASDGVAADNFGCSVALSGNTALVGAANDDIGVNTNQGSVYVFARSGTTWAQQAKLTASDGMAYDTFGYSVALSGNTALVGSRGDDVGANTSQGSAYVFIRSGATWTQQQQLFASDGVAVDSFGYSVAISGDTALVGATGSNVGANDNQGAAYIFFRSGTTWTQQAKLTASDGVNFVGFGLSVALEGDTALVGSPYHAVGAKTSQGSAYIFVKPGGGWGNMTQTAILTTGIFGAKDDYFGSSVALSGDTALIGAIGYNGTFTDQGAAYLFKKSGSTWTNMAFYSASFTAADGALSDEFGGSVALSSDTALVGAHLDDVGVNSDQGSVHFYQAYRDTDLAVSVANGSANSVINGTTIFLAASVSNYGPNAATDVALNVSLPAGLKYISHTTTYGTYTPATGSWSVGSLPVGAIATLTIQAGVNLISIPAKTVIFSAKSPVLDMNNANNTASLNLTVKKKERAKNGGFNTYSGTSKIPVNWVQTNFAAADGKDITAANIKEGIAAVKIANTTAKIKKLTQTITLSGAKGNPFIFSYWVKGNAIPATAGVCQAQVLFYNGTTIVGTPKTLLCGSTGTFAYKKVTMSFTAPLAYTKVIVRFTYSKATGTVWFDWVSLLK